MLLNDLICRISYDIPATLENDDLTITVGIRKHGVGSMQFRCIMKSTHVPGNSDYPIATIISFQEIAERLMDKYHNSGATYPTWGVAMFFILRDFKRIVMDSELTESYSIQFEYD